MIKGITSSGKYVVVNGGMGGSTYISPGAVGAGMLRYNSNSQNIEINDGNSWQVMGSTFANVELTPEAESLLDWARQKRIEEQSMQDMMDKYPALKKARDNYDLIWNIVKDEQHKDSI
jgi:hypothetical protein